MLINKQKYIDLIQSSPDMEVSDFIAMIEANLASEVPFDHTQDHSGIACGIPEERFEEEGALTLNSGGKTSEIAEAAEKKYTKREMAVVLTASLKQNEELESMLSILTSIGSIGIMGIVQD